MLNFCTSLLRLKQLVTFEKKNMSQYGSIAMVDQDQSQIDATRAQVNEVQDIMKTNIEKVMESEAKLSDLEGRADQLKVGNNQKVLM